MYVMLEAIGSTFDIRLVHGSEHDAARVRIDVGGGAVWRLTLPEAEELFVRLGGVLARQPEELCSADTCSEVSE